MELVKMLMKIGPHDKRIVGDVDGFNFPLPEGSIPRGIAPLESRSALGQVPPRDCSASS